MYEIDVDQEIQRIHKKNRETLAKARRRFADAENDNDEDKLGLALQAYHSLLEDYFRVSLVSKVPADIQKKILDVKETDWNKLLEYGEQYLGLSEQDAFLIRQANRVRNDFMHRSLEFKWEKADLEKYVIFVENFCAPITRKYPAHQAPRAEEYPPNRTDEKPPRRDPPSDRYTSYQYDKKRWYRSSWFYWLTFFLCTPLWALLILTDKKASGLAKTLVLLLFIIPFTLLCCGYLALTIAAIPIDSSIQNVLSSPTLPSSDTPTDQVTRSAISPNATATDSVSQTECQIIWEEYLDSSLARKNRDMVWEEIISVRVKNSGMTNRQFYKLVVEYNPTLATDGYEFLPGKVYLLPLCK